MTSGNSERQTYIPGVCNIGAEERRLRRKSGIVSAIATLVLMVVLLVTHASRPWRLLLFIPAFGAASGFLQDALHFCAGFGMRGVFNVLNAAGETEDVTTAEFQRQDRVKALQITGLSAVAGALVTAIALMV